MIFKTKIQIIQEPFSVINHDVATGYDAADPRHPRTFTAFGVVILKLTTGEINGKSQEKQ
jgi:hypothetical protein